VTVLQAEWVLQHLQDVAHAAECALLPAPLGPDTNSSLMQNTSA